MENKRKHLEFIQGAINRMAGNLFFLRGWTITLITALFRIFCKRRKYRFYFYCLFSSHYFLGIGWIFSFTGAII